LLESGQGVGHDDPAGFPAQNGGGVDAGEFAGAYPGADLVLAYAVAASDLADGQSNE
jgi:hypothetical protein